MTDTNNAHPTPSGSSKLQARLPQIIAILAACVAAYAASIFLRDGSNPNPRDSAFSGPLVGEIQSIEGQALIRPPRGTRFDAARPGPFRAESVLQTQSASSAVIEFRPGPTLKLLENSRLVAEIDTSRDGAIQATVLSGEVTVLNPGSNPLFALMQNGIPIDIHSLDSAVASTRLVPLIQIGSGENSAATSTSDLQEKLDVEKESELATAPAVDLQSVTSSTSDQRPKQLPAKNETGLLRSTLTNDDIRSQVRSQAGSFQKCYVTMVTRMSESGVAATALPKGQILVAFKILPTGKVEDSKVVTSPFNDKTFERCTAEAVGRLRFRQFQGAAIPVGEFPILLE